MKEKFLYSLRIGPNYYRFLKTPLSDNFGECDAQSKTIYIDSTVQDPVQAQTELHEIMHALFSEQGLSESSSEEQIVLGFERGLTCFVMDNRKYTEDLIKRLCIAKPSN